MELQLFVHFLHLLMDYAYRNIKRENLNQGGAAIWRNTPMINISSMELFQPLRPFALIDWTSWWSLNRSWEKAWKVTGKQLYEESVKRKIASFHSLSSEFETVFP